MENQNNINVLDEKKQNHDNQSNNMIEDQFASALPEWNLVPPAVIIKRVKRSI